MDQPTRLERFDIIEYCDLSPESTWQRIGSGSFGCVHRATYLGQDVAIKEIFDSSDYDTTKYLRREISLLQESRHPNIVLYLGICLAPALAGSDGIVKANGQRILIVSEFFSGGNLRSYIASTAPLPWRARVSFAIDITRAVAYLHARDIKPENVLMTDNGRLKLADFGFARMAPRNANEQRRASHCGTDQYMSSEMLKGETFDLRTDITSLGVIFAELISRQLADDSVFRRTGKDYIIDLDEIALRASLGCPTPFISLAQACCATKPEHRPDARQILRALQSIEAGLVRKEQAQAPQAVAQVGSMRFTDTISTRSAHRRMPRIPSFEGLVSIPISESAHSKPSLLGKGLPPRMPQYAVSSPGYNPDLPYDEPVGRIASTRTIRANDSMPLPMRRPSDESIPSVPSEWLREPARADQTRTPSLEDGSAASSAGSLPATPLDEDPFATFHTARTSHRDDDSYTVHGSEISGDSLHRFSLIKPNWLRLFVKTALTTPSDCYICMKKLGWHKEYLECDDCGCRKCADTATFDCPGNESDITPLLAKTQIKLRPKSYA